MLCVSMYNVCGFGFYGNNGTSLQERYCSDVHTPGDRLHLVLYVIPFTGASGTRKRLDYKSRKQYLTRAEFTPRMYNPSYRSIVRTHTVNVFISLCVYLGPFLDAEHSYC